VGEDPRQRGADRIAELAARGNDLITFWQEATSVIEEAIPHYWSPCWYTLDPASLLITSHYQDGMDEYPKEFFEAEYYEDDVNRHADVARSESGARGARTGLLVGEATDPQWPDSPGLVVLSADGEVESATPGVGQWLSDLPDGDWEAGRLPAAVRGVAGRALRTAEDAEHPGEIAMSRVLARSGTWVVLHGATLVSDGSRRVAIIVEPAHPARITPLLMAAYGLTEREQEVTRLVLQGDSTAQIAEQLVVSPHTVQEHLKGIFEKTGVRSRRDLVGKVFFAHYEPRFRDNEERMHAEKPLRGEPFPDGV
jgi:DNA-binding CsgD family transcriptional regulator